MGFILKSIVHFPVINTNAVLCTFIYNDLDSNKEYACQLSLQIDDDDFYLSVETRGEINNVFVGNYNYSFGPLFDNTSVLLGNVCETNILEEIFIDLLINYLNKCPLVVWTGYGKGCVSDMEYRILLVQDFNRKFKLKSEWHITERPIGNYWAENPDCPGLIYQNQLVARAYMFWIKWCKLYGNKT